MSFNRCSNTSMVSLRASSQSSWCSNWYLTDSFCTKELSVVLHLICLICSLFACLSSVSFSSKLKLATQMMAKLPWNCCGTTRLWNWNVISHPFIARIQYLSSKFFVFSVCWDPWEPSTVPKDSRYLFHAFWTTSRAPFLLNRNFFATCQAAKLRI